VQNFLRERGSENSTARKIKARVVIGSSALTPFRIAIRVCFIRSGWNPALPGRQTALWMIRSIKEAITGVEEQFPVGLVTKCVGVVGAPIERVVYRSAKNVQENAAQNIIQKAPFTIIL